MSVINGYIFLLLPIAGVSLPVGSFNIRQTGSSLSLHSAQVSTHLSFIFDVSNFSSTLEAWKNKIVPKTMRKVWSVQGLFWLTVKSLRDYHHQQVRFQYFCHLDLTALLLVSHWKLPSAERKSCDRVFRMLPVEAEEVFRYHYAFLHYHRKF